jgi:hypothetical protein
LITIVEKVEKKKNNKKALNTERGEGVGGSPSLVARKLKALKERREERGGGVDYHRQH